jgi:hypothetical protein
MMAFLFAGGFDHDVVSPLIELRLWGIEGDTHPKEVVAFARVVVLQVAPEMAFEFLEEFLGDGHLRAPY